MRCPARLHPEDTKAPPAKFIGPPILSPLHRALPLNRKVSILKPPSTDSKLSHIFFISLFVYLVLTVTSSNHQVQCEVTNQTCASFCLKIALQGVANGQCKHPVKLFMDTHGQTLAAHSRANSKRMYYIPRDTLTDVGSKRNTAVGHSRQ